MFCFVLYGRWRSWLGRSLPAIGSTERLIGRHIGIQILSQTRTVARPCVSATCLATHNVRALRTAPFPSPRRSISVFSCRPRPLGPCSAAASSSSPPICSFSSG